MPCDSIERTKVEFLAKSTDVKLLAKGLKARGFSVNLQGHMLYFSRYGQSGNYNAQTGRLDVPESTDTNEFKQAYAKEVVNSQAEENGWEVEWRTNESGNEEAVVEKRSY